jgi:hypothetical protein
MHLGNNYGMKQYLKRVRQSIAEGATDEAIQKLSALPYADPDISDSLILISNRLRNLDTSILDGVISREVENVERNKIHRSLLQLVKEVENLPKQEQERLKSALSDELLTQNKTVGSVNEVQLIRPLGKNYLLWTSLLIGGLGLVAATLLMGRSYFTTPKVVVSNPVLPNPLSDLVLKLSIENTNPNWIPKGYLKVQIGEYTGELQPFSSNETAFQLKNIKQVVRKQPLSVSFSDLKYPLKVVSQSAIDYSKTTEIIVKVKIETTHLSGKIVYPDQQPAANVEMNLENGLAITKTGAEGKFELILPALIQPTVLLTLKKNATVVMSKQVGLNETIFKEFKIPR